MPNLLDVPGKDLIAGTTKRARSIAVGVGSGALALGGLVARRLRGGGDDAEPDVPAASGADNGEVASAIADPGLVVEPNAARPAARPKAPEPKLPESPRPEETRPAKPKAPKPKVAKPKPAKSKAAKPKAAKSAPPKPKAAKPKPAPAKAAKPKSKREPGDQRGGKDPHHALNNPVADPDPTEYPDPFDKREDPRDPVDPDGMPFGDEPHPPTGAESTSEPPPAQDPEVGDRAKPPRREKLDD
jgi:hypothetical protein